MDLSFPEISRVQRTLLDAERQLHRERMQLAEGCGWTFKYVWDLEDGDEVIGVGLGSDEGIVGGVDLGPEGTTIHLDLGDGQLSPVVTLEELVRVSTPARADAF